MNQLTGLLGIVAEIPIVGPLLATGCTPITVVGLGNGANCAQQTVCCQNTQFVSNRLLYRMCCLFTPCRTALSTLVAPTSTLVCKGGRYQHLYVCRRTASNVDLNSPGLIWIALSLNNCETERVRYIVVPFRCGVDNY